MTSALPSLPPEVRDIITEPRRLEALTSLGVMDGQHDRDFDRLTGLAASIFDAPIGVIALVDQRRQWLASTFGLGDQQLSPAFAMHTIGSAEGAPLAVLDAAGDPRFEADASVRGRPYLRFFAGAPVVVRGHRVGVLAVCSREPRSEVSDLEMRQLGDLAGVVSSLFELKDEARVSARTAAALTREEWRHALTLEAGRVGSWIWDLRSNEVEANDTLKAMYGLTEPGRFSGDIMLSAIHPADREGVEAALDAAFAGSSDYFGEMRIAESGRWLVGRGRVYQRDAEGKPLVMMGISLDITETKEAAEHTRQLLLELNHRVKNTLAMIQSLARQTLRQSTSPQRFIEAFSGRLRTLSEMHGLLSDGDWAGVGLVSLIRGQIGANFLDDPRQLRLVGQDVLLPPDQALGLGLVLNELASNAAKYGALSSDDGVVTISWRLQTPDRLELDWVESGGPKVVAPEQKGFGSLLIERSLDKLMTAKVNLRFPPEGVEARISLPL